MKTLRFAPALLVLALVACTSTSTPSGGYSSSSVGTESSDTANARVIEISAENWKFGPNTIVAKQGEKVIIRLTGVSGRHGFVVPDLGISTSVSPDKTVDIELPTDQTGTFTFRCSIPCGPGHEGMTGTITIEA